MNIGWSEWNNAARPTRAQAKTNPGADGGAGKTWKVHCLFHTYVQK
jgi:hypothetical protein